MALLSMWVEVLFGIGSAVNILVAMTMNEEGADDGEW